MALTRYMTYKDKKYGFTLRIPGWWKPYVSIKGTVGEEEEEYALHFIFRYKGRSYGDICTLLVYRMTLKEWQREFEDSPLSAITEHRGRVFAYVPPGELPHEFLDLETGDYDYEKYGTPIRLMKRIVNQELPLVLGSLRFPEAAPVKPLSGLYLSKQVTPGTSCRCS